MPPTVSPSPFHSATPSHMSGPKETVPRSLMSTGVPFLAITGTFLRSSSDLRYPSPRIMYRVPLSSSTRPPTSFVLDFTRSITVDSGMPLCQQLVGIDIDPVLAHEPTDARHFGHAGNGCQLIAQVPILNASQIGEALLVTVIDEHIL